MFTPDFILWHNFFFPFLFCNHLADKEICMVKYMVNSDGRLNSVGQRPCLFNILIIGIKKEIN